MKTSPHHRSAPGALDPDWFTWAIAQGAGWSHARVVALFDEVDRLLAAGLTRHDAEHTALAQVLEAESRERSAA